MKKMFVSLLSLGFVGCATTSAINNVSLGMTKVEVIKTIGTPNSISAKDNVEYLRYNFAPLIREPDDFRHFYDYFVRLVNGKVESYGKVGDFDSTKNPAADINLNVKSESK